MNVCRFLILGLLLIGGCATAPKTPLVRFEFEEPQMGAPFKIILYAPNEAAAEAAVDKAFARISQLNAIMSDYEYDSELNKLGRTSGSGQKVKISDDLWTVLKAAEEKSRASDGAFDVTVAPVIQLWRKARRERKLPGEAAVAEARARTGYTNLILKDHTAELKVPNMRLDLGAIAKGFAADEALRVLRENGISHALCAASGDMALGDAPPGQRGWKVQVLNVADTNKSNLILKNCGVANSGDIFQFVEIDGVRYSHIVDPRTGIGLTNRLLVTVIAKDGMTADGLSTTLSVLGATKGLQFARQFHAEARVLDHTGVEESTAGFWKRR